MLQKAIYGSNIPSYKSLLFSFLTAFLKKNVLPTLLMEHLNAIFLSTKTTNTNRLAKHAFLQTPTIDDRRSFVKVTIDDRRSIVEKFTIDDRRSTIAIDLVD